MPSPCPFPDLLRDAMSRTGHTPRTLADELSTLIRRRRPAAVTTCTPDTVNRWLRGEAVPARTNIHALASLLGLDAGDVLRAREAQDDQIDIERASWSRP